MSPCGSDQGASAISTQTDDDRSGMSRSSKVEARIDPRLGTKGIVWPKTLERKSHRSGMEPCGPASNDAFGAVAPQGWTLTSRTQRPTSRVTPQASPSPPWCSPALALLPRSERGRIEVAGQHNRKLRARQFFHERPDGRGSFGMIEGIVNADGEQVACTARQSRHPIDHDRNEVTGETRDFQWFAYPFRPRPETGTPTARIRHFQRAKSSGRGSDASCTNIRSNIPA